MIRSIFGLETSLSKINSLREVFTIGPITTVQFGSWSRRACVSKIASTTKSHRAGRRSNIRAIVEHVFAHQKAKMGLLVRIIGIDRAGIKIGMANLAYNLSRFVWHPAQGLPA